LIDVTLRPNPSNYPIHSSLLDTLRDQNIPNIPGVPLASLARHFGPAGPNKPAETEFPDSFLLPQAFPEGSPMHPSLPQGHATVGAACATILKAWFDESFIIPNPKVVNPQGNAVIDAPGTRN
jgi:hypothetical protein